MKKLLKTFWPESNNKTILQTQKIPKNYKFTLVSLQNQANRQGPLLNQKNSQ